MDWVELLMSPELRELMERLSNYRKLPVTHPEYVNDHFVYLQLEAKVDEMVIQEFLKTNRGKLDVNGKYF